MSNNTKSTAQTLEQLYLDRNKTGDITFVVDSERIQAHRWVLAAASPKFAVQFYGSCADKNEISIPNIPSSAFEEFLQFFYKQTIELTIENIEIVLDLAKQSLVYEFTANCINFIKSKTTIQNVCWAYRLAMLYDIESLRIECERKISNGTKEVFASIAFINCNHDILMQILHLNFMNCTENDACIVWAHIKCKEANLDVKNSANLRTVLGDAIYQIRFSTMSIGEFAAAYKMVEGLYTSDEILEIVYMIGHLDGFTSQKFNKIPRIKTNQMKINPPEATVRYVFVQEQAMTSHGPSNWRSSQSRHFRRQQHRFQQQN